MSASKLILSVCLLACFLKRSLSKDQQQITVKTGDDVTLQCLDPRGGDIKLLEWRRQDLKDEGYVYYYEGRPRIKDYQHSSFQDRVELVDPKMKNGNVSVILKNVTINDTGTYECYVASGGRPELINTITLTVRVSGDNKRGGDEDGNVGLKVGLSVVALLVGVVGVVGVVMYRKRKGPKEETSYKAPDDKDTDHQ
ncbi:Programmed cell death 1 ligand 1 [Channa argus]|uniref:Programmed cell death 1 ligand 1 n=1 Tax=Channa argus TaxID=215402 RepID=A0A6G1Q6R1_CHAAH|nr:Programmed cell death 1 ligand 1 [Channa argus]